MLAFLSPGKKPSIQALTDLDEIVSKLGKASERVLYVVVCDDPNTVSAIPRTGRRIRLATPRGGRTVQAVGAIRGDRGADSIRGGLPGQDCADQGGHRYDFAPVIQAKLRAVLGLDAEDPAAETGQVKTLDNNKPVSKAAQHLQMAKMLVQKRKYDSALEQLGMAQKLDPNSVEIALEVGRMYCQASKPEMAIATVKPLGPTGNEQVALRSFILGKSYRLMKDWAQAEKNLLDALKQPERQRNFL